MHPTGFNARFSRGIDEGQEVLSPLVGSPAVPLYVRRQDVLQKLTLKGCAHL